VLCLAALQAPAALHNRHATETYPRAVADTVPATAAVKTFTGGLNAKVTKEKPPKEKNFIKLLLTAFKFKANADANERIRIQALLDTLRIDANLGILTNNIKLLEAEMVIAEDSLARLKFVVDSMAHHNDSLRTEWNAVITAITDAYNQQQDADSKFLSDRIIRERIYNINKILASLKIRTAPDEYGKLVKDSTSLREKERPGASVDSGQPPFVYCFLNSPEFYPAHARAKPEQHPLDWFERCSR